MSRLSDRIAALLVAAGAACFAPPAQAQTAPDSAAILTEALRLVEDYSHARLTALVDRPLQRLCSAQCSEATTEFHSRAVLDSVLARRPALKICHWTGGDAPCGDLPGDWAVLSTIQSAGPATYRVEALVLHRNGASDRWYVELRPCGDGWEVVRAGDRGST